MVNVGIRQNLRERNANVIDAATCGDEFGRAVDKALANGRYPACNIYGCGQAGSRIVANLLAADLDGAVLLKANTY